MLLSIFTSVGLGPEPPLLPGSIPRPEPVVCDQSMPVPDRKVKRFSTFIAIYDHGRVGSLRHVPVHLHLCSIIVLGRAPDRFRLIPSRKISIPTPVTARASGRSWPPRSFDAAPVRPLTQGLWRSCLGVPAGWSVPAEWWPAPVADGFAALVSVWTSQRVGKVIPENAFQGMERRPIGQDGPSPLNDTGEADHTETETIEGVDDGGADFGTTRRPA